MEKISSFLFKIEKIIGQVMLAFLLLLIVVNILLRYIFNMPIFWSEEVSNALFIWIGFIGTAYALGNSSLISLTTLSDKFKGKSKVILDLIIDIIIVVFVVIMLYSSIEVWPFLMITPALKIHEGIIFISVPISFALMVIHQLIKIAKNIFYFRKLMEEGKVWNSGHF